MKIYRISKYILIYLLVRGHWILMVRVGADEESDGGTGSTSPDAGSATNGAPESTPLAAPAANGGSTEGTDAGLTSADGSANGAGADAGSALASEEEAESVSSGEAAEGSADAAPTSGEAAESGSSAEAGEAGSSAEAGEAGSSAEAADAGSYEGHVAGETDGTGSSGEEDQASSGTGHVAEAPDNGSGTSAEGDSGSSSGQTSEGAGSADSGSAEGSVAVPAEGASSGEGASSDGADANVTVSTDADGSVASYTDGSGVAEGTGSSTEHQESGTVVGSLYPDTYGSVVTQAKPAESIELGSLYPDYFSSGFNVHNDAKVFDEHLEAKKEEAKRLAEEARKTAEQLLKQAEQLTKAVDESSEIQQLENIVETTQYNIKAAQSELNESSEPPDLMYYTGFPDGWHRMDEGAEIQLTERWKCWKCNETYYNGFPDGWHFGDPIMLREIRRHELSSEIEKLREQKDNNVELILSKRHTISQNQDKKIALLKQIEELDNKSKGLVFEIKILEEQNKQLELERAGLILDVYALRYTESELAERIKEKEASQTVIKIFKDDNDGNKVELSSGVEYELKQVSGDDRFEIKDGVKCTLIKLGDHDLWKNGERELQEPNLVAFNQNAGVVGVLDDNMAVIFKKDTNSGTWSYHNSAPRQKGSGSDATSAELEPGKAAAEQDDATLALPADETSEANEPDPGEPMAMNTEAKVAGEGASEESEPSEPKTADTDPDSDAIVSPDASLTVASVDTSGVNEVDASDAKAEGTEAAPAPEAHEASSSVAAPANEETPPANAGEAKEAGEGEAKAESAEATPAGEGTQEATEAVRLFKSDTDGNYVEMLVADYTKKQASGDDRYEFVSGVSCTKVMFGSHEVWKKGDHNVNEPKLVAYNATAGVVGVLDDNIAVIYKKDTNSGLYCYHNSAPRQKGSGSSSNTAHSGSSAHTGTSATASSAESAPDPGSLSTGLTGSKTNLASTSTGSGETDDTYSATSGEGSEHNENESGSSTALRGSNEGLSECGSSGDGSTEGQDSTS